MSSHGKSNFLPCLNIGLILQDALLNCETFSLWRLRFSHSTFLCIRSELFYSFTYPLHLCKELAEEKIFYCRINITIPEGEF
jgi:hypothetical protein